MWMITPLWQEILPGKSAIPERNFRQDKQMTRIFIGGMCSLPLGTMERQLGNMAILIPMLKMLQREMPGVKIVTSLQLSEKFCQEHAITSLDIKSLYQPTLKSGVISVIDWLRSGIWRFIKDKVGADLKWLISGKKFAELLKSDIVLDFSGDTYGDMAHFTHLVKHSLDLLTFLNIKKPVYIFAQSPGPFSTFFRKQLARLVLARVTLITCREHMSFKTLNALPVKPTPVFETACPAWLLEPAEPECVKKINLQEQITHFEKPLVGFNFCGFNVASELISRDKYKEQRPDEELAPLVAVLRYLLDELKVNVVMVPHVYRMNLRGEMVPGPDGKITDQLYNLVIKQLPEYKEKLMVVRGTYQVSEIKAVIGQCDLFVAGRLHAGVAAMSQCIPTILLAYGYKHYGFARLAGLEHYVSNNFKGVINAGDIIEKVGLAWKLRGELSGEIARRMVTIRALSDLNAALVKEVVASCPKGSNRLSGEIITFLNTMTSTDMLAEQAEKQLGQLDST
jgi:colanic acid/amylovoran biosynthesis protein